MLSENVHTNNDKTDRELNQLRRSLEGLNVKLIQYETMVATKDEEVNELKKKLYQIVSKDETRRINAMNIFNQVYKRPQHSKSDQKEIDLIGMYEEQRSQLKREVSFLRKEVQRLNDQEVLKQEQVENYSRNDEQVKKVIAQIRIERERYSTLDAEYNALQQKFNTMTNQHERMISNLEDENLRLLKEIKTRPAAQEFDSVRKQNEEMKLELIELRRKQKELEELKKA